MAGPLPWFCDLPIRRPRVVLIGLLLATLGVGSGALKTSFDPSTEKVFPEGHPAVETFKDFREVFGGDESISVAFELPAGIEDVFSRESLALARELGAVLGDVEGVERAFSVADVPVITFSPMGFPTLAPGLPEDLSAVDDEALATWRGRVLTTPFVVGSLVSGDHRATAVVVVVERLPDGVEGALLNQTMVSTVRGLIASYEETGVRFHLAGSPVIKAEIMATIQDDMITFAPPLVLLAAFTALVVLRSLRGMALVLGVLGVTNALVLGAMGHLGIPINSMSSLIPSLILVIGVADSLHLLVEQRAQAVALGPGSKGADTIKAAIEHVTLPCTLTTLTTGLGFGSLLSSDIAPIREFGVGAAVGALVALVVTLTLIPAVQALAPPTGEAPPRAPRLEGLARFALARPWVGAVLGLGILVAGAVGVQRVELDTDFLGFFEPQSRLVQDAVRIQSLFGGVAPCELIVDGPPDCSHDPAALRALSAFQLALEQHELVDMSFSLADFLMAAVQLRTGTPQLPETREQVLQLEGVIQGVAGGRLPMERLVSKPDHPKHPGREWLRVTVRAQAVGSARMVGLLERIEELEAEHLTPLGLSVTPTGTSVVFSKTVDRIIMGQIESFLWAFGTISLVMILALRSLRLGLVSILPNMIPIAAILAVMGLSGIPLNSFNSMVVSVAIGIAVDDTIHVLTGFQRFSRTRATDDAIRETIAHEGAAVVSTSLVLLAGFGVLLFASFRPTLHFGLLTGISIGAALLGDLLVLPTLLRFVPWRCGGGAAQTEPEPGGAEA